MSSHSRSPTPTPAASRIAFVAPDYSVVSYAASELATLRAALTAAQADAALWRQKVMDTRELIALVSELADQPSVATATALINHYQMWRRCVEAGAPVTWALPAPVIDEWEAARAAAEEDAPW